MKQNCWRLYQDLVKAKYYFQFYKGQAARTDRILSIIIAIISSASVASWLIWKDLTILWAIIIGASNILTILKPYLPYEKRVSAVSYMLPELKVLINEVEYFYNIINSGKNDIDDNEISDCIRSFKQAYTSLENRFIDNAIFSDNPKIAKKAEISAKKELTDNIR